MIIVSYNQTTAAMIAAFAGSIPDVDVVCFALGLVLPKHDCLPAVWRNVIIAVALACAP